MKWEEIVRIAKGDIGKSRDEVGCSGDGAWCAQWVSSVLNRAGVGDDVADISCTLMQKKMSNNVNWYEPLDWPKPGDEIFFDFDHKIEERPLDHVGICIRFDEDTLDITYVNGNGSSAHYVTEQVLNVNATDKQGRKLVSYWMRYIGDLSERPADEEPKTEEPETEPEDEPADNKEIIITARQLSKGMSGGDVKTLQRLLFADGYSVGKCGDDGEYGNDTEKAVRNYQEDHRLEVDGIAGVNTLNTLYKCEKASRQKEYKNES